jgi:hypothetical protein
VAMGAFAEAEGFLSAEAALRGADPAEAAQRAPDLG